MMEVFAVIAGCCLVGSLVRYYFRRSSLPPKAQLLCDLWGAASSPAPNKELKSSSIIIPSES